MLKIYHQDSLRRVQRRQLGAALGVGVIAGLVLTFNGSTALVDLAYADAPAVARPAPSGDAAPDAEAQHHDRPPLIATLWTGRADDPARPAR